MPDPAVNATVAPIQKIVVPAYRQVEAVQLFDSLGQPLDSSGGLSVLIENPAQGSATAGQTGGLVQGAVTTAAPTYVTGTTDPLSLTTKGALREALVDASGNEFDYTLPVDVSQALKNPTDLSQVPINEVTSGDRTIVAAVAGQTTRVHRVRIYTLGAVTIIVKRGSTTLETIPFAGAGAIVLDFDARPYYTTGTNEAFILNLSGAVQIYGMVAYVTSV